MKKSKFSDSQIMEAFKRVEAGLPVPELCREVGISTATFYKWRAKFGGMDTSMTWLHNVSTSQTSAKGGIAVEVGRRILIIRLG